VECLWISNEKYATTVLIELSKPYAFSGKEGLSLACNEDELHTASYPGKICRHRYADKR
jgi:hypothetical protein